MSQLSLWQLECAYNQVECFDVICGLLLIIYSQSMWASPNHNQADISIQSFYSPSLHILKSLKVFVFRLNFVHFGKQFGEFGRFIYLTNYVVHIWCFTVNGFPKFFTLLTKKRFRKLQSLRQHFGTWRQKLTKWNKSEGHNSEFMAVKSLPVDVFFSTNSIKDILVWQVCSLWHKSWTVSTTNAFLNPRKIGWWQLPVQSMQQK